MRFPVVVASNILAPQPWACVLASRFRGATVGAGPIANGLGTALSAGRRALQSVTFESRRRDLAEASQLPTRPAAAVRLSWFADLVACCRSIRMWLIKCASVGWWSFRAHHSGVFPVDLARSEGDRQPSQADRPGQHGRVAGVGCVTTPVHTFVLYHKSVAK